MERGVWTHQPGMNRRRSGAARSVIKDGSMLVTGGTEKEYEYLSSTELFKDGQWMDYYNLPVKMCFHCQVTTESGVIVAG